MKIEICANSYESAINAEKAGADRIELCAELAVGGVTPSHGLIEKVVKELTIPVYVLIRPRSGDFTYSPAEIDVMKKDIEYCKSVGCKGIVSGVLNADQTIDIEKTKELVELSSPLSFTFHRAFDWVTDPEKAMQKLDSLGIDRVLTSGHETKAIEGLHLLKKLRQHKSRVKILPGGGINANNILSFKENGFDEVHLSATSIIKHMEKPRISMNSTKFLDDTIYVISEHTTIEKIKKMLI